MSTPGKDIIEGLEVALAYAKGDKSRARAARVPDTIDVREIRKRLDMTQQEFSLQFGFALGTLRNWEQGHRKPQGPSRVLLTLIKKMPDEVKRALAA